MKIVARPAYSLFDGKICTKCGVWKLAEEFSRCSKARDGRKPRCKACISAQNRKPPRPLVSPNNGTEKRCRTCNQWLPIGEFHKAATSPDGLSYKCKTCHKAYQEANKEHIQQQNKARYAANPEIVIQRVREWRQAQGDNLPALRSKEYLHSRYRTKRSKGRKLALNNGTEKLCPTCKQWLPFDAFPKMKRSSDGLYPRCRDCLHHYREENQVQLRQKKRQYYAAHHERVLRQRREWAAAHPDAVKQSKQRDYKHNKATYKAASRTRRALKHGSEGTHTMKEWLALCAFFGNACLCCGATDNLHCDHVIPLSKGGRNDIANLQPLCQSCNSRKHAQFIDYRDPAMLAAFLASVIP